MTENVGHMGKGLLLGLQWLDELDGVRELSSDEMNEEEFSRCGKWYSS